MPRKKVNKTKPLARVRKPLKAAAYRAEFTPFDALEFIDRRALARSAKARIELGVVTTPVGSATLVADVRAGEVVGLRLKDCPNCPPKRSKLAKDDVKKAMSQLRVDGHIKLPMPVTRMFGRAGLRIPIGPIIIVIGEPDMTFCIEWTRADGTICWWCLFDASGCMKMGPPL